MTHPLTVFEERLKSTDLKQSTIQFEIDGLMYTSTKLPASIGLELLPRLTVLVGPVIMRALTSADGLSLIDPSLLVRIAERALKDGLLPLAKDLLARMQCNKLRPMGQGSVLSAFDEHFAGEYAHLGKVCWFAIAHNFRGPTLGAL